MADIIAIDGPSGAGKSTIAKKIAELLGYLYLDTGAMYRCVAYIANQSQIDTNDTLRLCETAKTINIRFKKSENNYRVYANDFDVTDLIRTTDIGNLASIISAIPKVRVYLVAKQKLIGESTNLVTEGRDQTTVVFPNARVKIFLTASPEERARRRALELTQKGICVSYETILAEQIERDTRDSTRSSSPLRQADDAILIDTDGLSIEEVVLKIMEYCKR